ncbi:MAG: amino acid ABC transporter substrate-binding protein [Actinobacteria bacterium]|nr:MAG: amino acid ABC transporter substrate-binding protein [Actinomycetota bacterium]
MKRTTSWSGLVALVGAAVAVAVIAGATGGHAATDAKRPIVIGWAFDSKGKMAPFDDPALAAARIRVKQINAKGGVGGRHLVIKTCDTQNNDPTTAKACAVRLLAQGAKIIFTTCDVDYATPVVQAGINRGVLAIAPCIGTDQMGPKRFAAKGKLAFSFGNVAQDEGSAMAEYAHSRGWKTAGLATNTLLVYFKNVVQAFDKRFRQLGGKVVDRESYATGANNVHSAVTRLNSHKAQVYVTSTSFGELPAFVSGFRSLGNKTPIINSWAGDGTYWVTKNPKVTNYYFVTYASVFGDDPSLAVRRMIAALKRAHAAPATGGFLGGADAIDGIVTAIKRAHGSTKGSVLAAKLVRFHRVPVLGGRISFSGRLHTVFGRDYRVIEINNNKAHLKGLIRAKVIPTL